MPRNKFLRIVVDADVLKAAGSETAKHPISTHCRDFLDTISNSSCSVVCNSELQDEWDTHMSHYSALWLGEMGNQSRSLFVKDTKREMLGKEFRSVSVREDEREKIEKDFHVIDCAICTDNHIASLECSLKNLLCSICSQWPTLLDLYWVDPDKSFDAATAWLRKGAHRRPSFKIGFKGK